MDEHGQTNDEVNKNPGLVLDPLALDSGTGSSSQENIRSSKEFDKFEQMSQNLFVEQYKATRAEILISVQTSQRMLQYIFTAIIAVSGFMASYISALKSPLLVSGYVISFVFGFILCFVIAVTIMAWFMEMLRLSRVIIFLKYLEDKVKIARLNNKYWSNDESWRISDLFENYTIFWENWVRGIIERDVNRNFISKIPYMIITFFVLFTALSAEIFSIYIFTVTYYQDIIFTMSSHSSCLDGFFCAYDVSSRHHMPASEFKKILWMIVCIEHWPDDSRLQNIMFACRLATFFIAVVYLFCVGFVCYWLNAIGAENRKIRQFIRGTDGYVMV